MASQEEYLLALQGRRQMGESTSEVARGSQICWKRPGGVLNFGISRILNRELEKTGKVSKALPIHSPITGTVIKKEAVAGAHVDPARTLHDREPSRVLILADIHEYELSFVKAGQKSRRHPLL
ncbi:MAG: efflux RND transporter periplasmic adaptor subunit [Nitrospiraceae bacterium]